HCPNAAVYFTTSKGDNDSLGFPPIVPLIPDILLMSAKIGAFCGCKFTQIQRLMQVLFY
ncbi:MAG: hypothetical protein RL642_680, partial [Bacteroidota bacterium]